MNVQRALKPVMIGLLVAGVLTGSAALSVWSRSLAQRAVSLSALSEISSGLLDSRVAIISGPSLYDMVAGDTSVVASVAPESAARLLSSPTVFRSCAKPGVCDGSSRWLPSADLDWYVDNDLSEIIDTPSDWQCVGSQNTSSRAVFTEGLRLACVSKERNLVYYQSIAL